MYDLWLQIYEICTLELFFEQFMNKRNIPKEYFSFSISVESVFCCLEKQFEEKETCLVQVFLVYRFFLCWTYKLCASCGFKSKSNVILGSLQFFMMEKNLSNVWSVFFVMYLIMVFKRFMIERNLSNAHFVILNQQNCIFESEFV